MIAVWDASYLTPCNTRVESVIRLTEDGQLEIAPRTELGAPWLEGGLLQIFTVGAFTPVTFVTEPLRGWTKERVECAFAGRRGWTLVESDVRAWEQMKEWGTAPCN